MSLSGVILGSIIQLMLALYLFMLAVFAGCGVANCSNLSTVHIKILDLALYALPVLCIISASIVIYFYFHDGSNNTYWWYSMPIGATIVYLAYVKIISKTSGSTS